MTPSILTKLNQVTSNPVITVTSDYPPLTMRKLPHLQPAVTQGTTSMFSLPQTTNMSSTKSQNNQPPSVAGSYYPTTQSTSGGLIRHKANLDIRNIHSNQLLRSLKQQQERLQVAQSQKQYEFLIKNQNALRQQSQVLS